MSDFRVVLSGGGIVAPNDELVMRPLAVRQPFVFGPIASASARTPASTP
jgi:hypothetical protein